MPIQFVVDEDSKVPPYDQIKRSVIEAIANEDAVVEEKLPAIRTLASELGLAVNTVARSYRELEEEGYVVTRGRSGTRVSSSAVPRLIGLNQLAAEFAGRTRALGVSNQEILDAVESALPN